MEPYCWSRTAGERGELSPPSIFFGVPRIPLLFLFAHSAVHVSALSVQELGITAQCAGGAKGCLGTQGLSWPIPQHRSDAAVASFLVAALVLWVRHTCIMSAVAPEAGLWGFKCFVKYRRELRSCSCVSFSRLPRKQGSILYCTTGIVLQWLQSDK